MIEDLTAAEIRDAFDSTEPWLTTLVTCYYNGTWHIDGVISCTECSCQVGRFSRRLTEFKGDLIAIHDAIRIEPLFRRMGIAWRHYSKCIQQYYIWNVRHVEMFANEYGPAVWAQFGFTFSREAQKQAAKSCFEEMIALIINDSYTMEPDDTEAYNMVFLEVSDGRSHLDQTLGAIALKRAAERQESGALEYVLELNAPKIRELLQEIGLLADRKYDQPGKEGDDGKWTRDSGEGQA